MVIVELRAQPARLDGSARAGGAGGQGAEAAGMVQVGGHSGATLEEAWKKAEEAKQTLAMEQAKTKKEAAAAQWGKDAAAGQSVPLRPCLKGLWSRKAPGGMCFSTAAQSKP